MPGFVSELIVSRASEDWGVGGDGEWFLSVDQDVEENLLADFGWKSPLGCIFDVYVDCSDSKVKLHWPCVCRPQISQRILPALQDASERGYIDCFD